MTKENAKEYLINISYKLGTMAVEYLNEKDGEKMREAIKTLEQEPILDELRAEIRHFMYDINPSSSESDYACNYILQIIDKYKADRSVEDGNVD